MSTDSLLFAYSSQPGSSRQRMSLSLTQNLRHTAAHTCLRHLCVTYAAIRHQTAVRSSAHYMGCGGERDELRLSDLPLSDFWPC
jgi:hypothetical protein